MQVHEHSTACGTAEQRTLAHRAFFFGRYGTAWASLVIVQTIEGECIDSERRSGQCCSRRTDGSFPQPPGTSALIFIEGDLDTGEMDWMKCGEGRGEPLCLRPVLIQSKARARR